MRTRHLLAALLLLAACDQLPSTPQHAVDANHLPPLSGAEQALLISADNSASAGDYDSAERNYLGAIGRSQGHVEAHIALAQLYLRQGKTAQAEEILNRAAVLQPKNPEVNHLLGKIEIGKNQPAQALTYYNRGLEAAPQNIDLLSGAGVAEDMLYQHKAAQHYYLRALDAQPAADLFLVKSDLAMSYLLDNNAKDAAFLLKDEAKKPGAPPVLRENLALAYGMLGKNVEARKLIGGSMSEDERQASIMRLRAYIAHKTNGPPPAPKEDPKLPPQTREATTIQPSVQSSVFKIGQ